MTATPIRCKRDGCLQVIAQRWCNGRIKPVTTDVYADERGRLTITCPVCGERNRLPENRAAHAG